MFEKLLGAATGIALMAQVVSAQQGPTLKVGDPAPQLDHVEWLKGEEIASYEEGEIYVLDFWATWCPPCVASIPHINELQQKHKDDGVNVVGVAVWPNQRMIPTADFVEARGDGMDYRIATDINNKTAEAFLTASNARGIPTVYVVDKEGTLAWIWDPGQPIGELDIVVDLLVKDEFSEDRVKEEVAELVRIENEKRAKVEPVNARFRSAIQTGDWEGVEESLEELFALEPAFVQGDYSQYLYVAKMKLGKKDKARKYVADLMSSALKSNPQAYSTFAWLNVGPGGPFTEEERNVEFAITVAEKAAEASKGEIADILDTLARAYFVDGRIDEAVATQREAVEKAGDDADFYTISLEQYEKAASDG